MLFPLSVIIEPERIDIGVAHGDFHNSRFAGERSRVAILENNRSVKTVAENFHGVMAVSISQHLHIHAFSPFYSGAGKCGYLNWTLCRWAPRLSLAHLHDFTTSTTLVPAVPNYLSYGLVTDKSVGARFN